MDNKISKNINLDTLLGSIVLIATLTLSIFIYTRSLPSSFSGTVIKANFEHVGVLKVGSNVKIKGKVVGIVEHIDMELKDFQVTVTMRFANGVNIPVDSSAKIIGLDVFPTMFIEITPGMSNQYIQNNQTIDYTERAVTLDYIIDKVVNTNVKSMFNF